MPRLASLTSQTLAGLGIVRALPQPAAPTPHDLSAISNGTFTTWAPTNSSGTAYTDARIFGAMFINDEGTYLEVAQTVGTTRWLRRYDLSTPHDLNTAVFRSETQVFGNSTYVGQQTWSKDGLKYYSGRRGLSTLSSSSSYTIPYDDTSTLVQSINNTTQMDGRAVNGDNYRFNNTVFYYTNTGTEIRGTNISNGMFPQTWTSFSATTTPYNAVYLSFGMQGRLLYVSDNSLQLYKYALTNPYNINSSWTLLESVGLPIGYVGASYFKITDDGRYFYCGNATGVSKFVLDTGYGVVNSDFSETVPPLNGWYYTPTGVPVQTPNGTIWNWLNLDALEQTVHIPEGRAITGFRVNVFDGTTDTPNDAKLRITVSDLESPSRFAYTADVYPDDLGDNDFFMVNQLLMKNDPALGVSSVRSVRLRIETVGASLSASIELRSITALYDVEAPAAASLMVNAVSGNPIALAPGMSYTDTGGWNGGPAVVFVPGNEGFEQLFSQPVTTAGFSMEAIYYVDPLNFVPDDKSHWVYGASALSTETNSANLAHYADIALYNGAVNIVSMQQGDNFDGVGNWSTSAFNLSAVPGHWYYSKRWSTDGTNWRYTLVDLTTSDVLISQNGAAPAGDFKGVVLGLAPFGSAQINPNGSAPFVGKISMVRISQPANTFDPVIPVIGPSNWTAADVTANDRFFLVAPAPTGGEVLPIDFTELLTQASVSPADIGPFTPTITLTFDNSTLGISAGDTINIVGGEVWFNNNGYNPSIYQGTRTVTFANATTLEFEGDPIGSGIFFSVSAYTNAGSLQSGNGIGNVTLVARA